MTYNVFSGTLNPGVELGPHVTQCCPGRGLSACQVSSWSLQTFGYNTPTLQTGQTHRETRQDNGPIA